MTPDVLNNRKRLLQVLQQTGGYSDITLDALDKNIAADSNYALNLWSRMMNDNKVRSKAVEISPGMLEFKSFLNGEQPAPSQGGPKKNEATPSQPVVSTGGQAANTGGQTNSQKPAATVDPFADWNKKYNAASDNDLIPVDKQGNRMVVPGTPEYLAQNKKDLQKLANSNTKNWRIPTDDEWAIYQLQQQGYSYEDAKGMVAKQKKELPAFSMTGNVPSWDQAANRTQSTPPQQVGRTYRQPDGMSYSSSRSLVIGDFKKTKLYTDAVEAALKEYDNLTYTTGTQDRAADKSKVREWLSSYLKKNGSNISANEGLGDYLHGNITSALEAKSYEIRANTATESFIQKKYPGQTVESLIQGDLKRQIDSRANPLIADFKNEVSPIQEKTNSELNNLTANYKTNADAITANYQDGIWIKNKFSGKIPQGVDPDKYIQEQYKSELDKLYAEYKAQHGSLSADARRQITQIQNVYKAKLGELSKQKLGRINPALEKDLNEAYAFGIKSAIDDRNFRRVSAFNKQVGDIPVLRQFGILSRSLASGTANLLANAATWVDANLGYRYSTYFRDQFQDFSRDMSLPSNPLKNWSDLLDADKLMQNLGEMAPPIIVSIAASAATRRPVIVGLELAGAGTTATTVGGLTAAGVGGMISENIQRQGQVLQQLQEQGVDPKTALERSTLVWQNPIRDIAFNALSFELLFGKTLSGSFTKRFLVGAPVEAATETAQEVPQTREEEEALGVPESQRATIKETALAVLPTSILMQGVSSAVMAKQNNEPVIGGWINSIAQYPINKISEQINNTNKNLVQASIDMMAMNGVIPQAKTEELAQIVENVDSHVQEAKKNGLNKKQTNAYVSLIANAENIANQIAEVKANPNSTEEQVKALEQRHTTAINAAKSLLTEKSGNYAVVTQKDGDQIVVTHEQLNDLLDQNDFQQEVKSGETSVDIKYNKKATFDVSSLHTKISALNKRFDQPTAVYQNEEAITKSLDQRLGIERQQVPGPSAKVGGLIGQQVRLQNEVEDVTGTLVQDGQTLAIENDRVIRELGNVNDLRDATPKELGLTHIVPEEKSPNFETKTEDQVSIPALISLYAGKMNPENLINTIKMVVPSIDRNVLAAQVYAWDNAHRQTNRKVEMARQTDQDKRSPSKIEAPTAEVGKEYTGAEVAEVVAEVGDATTKGAIDKMTQASGQNFIGQEINLDELYATNEAFAARVEQERSSKKGNVEQSKKTYSAPENTPAIVIGDQIVDGMGRLAQKYINGDKSATAFVSTGKAASAVQQQANNQQEPQSQKGNPQTSRTVSDQDADNIIQQAFDQVFGAGNVDQNSLSSQAARAQQSLVDAGIQDAQVVVHNTSEEYEAAVASVGGNPNSNGNVAFRTVDGKKQVYRIDINGATANSRTLAHELAHAVLINGFGTNEELFNQFKAQVRAVLKSSDVKSLNDFASNYDSNQAEEFLAELAGALNTGEVSPTILSKIAQIINDIVSKLSGGKLIPFEDIQSANDILDMLRTLDPMIGSQQSTGENIGSRSQATSLAKGTETLKRFGVKPDSKPTTRVVAKALEERQRAKYGTIDANDRSPEARRKISNWMVEEVKYFIGEMGENSGKDWYGEKYQKALDAMSQIFPEFSNDQNARDLFTMLVAITSDGQKVLTNFKLASMAYEHYKNNGELPAKLPGNRKFDKNLAAINQLLKDNDGDIAKIKEGLLNISSIKDINARRKSEGLELVKSSWPVEFNAPYAAAVFGPKLGMFYANLSGQENYPTLDRWWSRTFNRYRGNLLQSVKRGFSSKGVPIGLDRLKEMLGDPNMSDDQVYFEARNLRDSYAEKGYKNGTELEKAGNTVYKNVFENLNDSPFNKNDRQFMYDAVTSAVKKLNNSGYDLTIADVQAILWYFEKNLYKKLGVRANIAGISYEEAANMTFDKWKNAGNSFSYNIGADEDIATVEDADEEIEDEESGTRSQVRPTMMVSPNEQEGTQFDKSLNVLSTPEMDKYVKSLSAVDKVFGLDQQTDKAVGVWTDGAEQSTVSIYQGQIEFQKLRAVGAVKGLLSNQKAVLVFNPLPGTQSLEGGGGLLFTAQVNMDAKAVTDMLTNAGIEYKTVVPVGNSDTKFYLYTDEKETGLLYDKFFNDNNIDYEYEYGQGEFVGTWGQREEAYPIYNQAIRDARSLGVISPEQEGDFQKRDDESIDNYRNRVSKILSEQSGEDVSFTPDAGIRSQKYSDQDTNKFIEQLRNAGLTDQQLERALTSRLGLTPQAAASLVESSKAPQQSKPKTNSDLVKEALAAIKSGQSEADVRSAIELQVQDPNLANQIFDTAKSLDVAPTTNQQEADEARQKVDKALTPPKSKKPGFFARTIDFFTNLSYYFDNPNRFITKLQEQVEKKYGKNTSSIPLGRLFERNATGLATTRVKRFTDDVISGLNKKELAQLEKYIFLRRIIDRNQQDAINKQFSPDASSRATGNISLQDAVNALNQLESEVGSEMINDFQDRADKFQQLADENLQLLLYSGIISQEAYDNIKQQNDFYAPFNVAQEALNYGVDNSNTPMMPDTVVRKISGIDESTEFAISNLIDRMAAIIFDSTIIANKNDMMLRLDKLAEIDTEGLFIKRLPSQKGMSLATVKTEEGFAPVSYRKDGQTQFLSVNKKAADTINGLDRAQLAPWMKSVNFINGAFRTAVITLSPSFQLANFVIDFMRNASFNRYGLLTGRNVVDRISNVVLYVPQYIEGLLTATAGNLGVNTPLWEEFMKGGAFSQGIFDDPFNDTGGARSLSLRTANGFTKTKNNISKLINFVGTVMEQSHKLVSIERGMDTEAGIRLGINKIKDIVSSAKTPEDLSAALDKVVYETQNLAGSPNFAATSSTMKTMSVVFQFLSARVKGEMTDWRRLTNTFTGTGEGVKMSASERIQMMTQIGGLMSLIALMAIRNHEDDDEKEFYSMGAYDRDNNINIPMGTFDYMGQPTREYIKIPVRGIPQMVNVMSNAYLKWRKGKDQDALKDGFMKSLGSASPFSISGDNSQEMAQSFLGSTTPLFKYMIESTTNTNLFLHKELVPEKFGTIPIKRLMDDGYIRPDNPLFSPPLRKRVPEWAKDLSTMLYDDFGISFTPIAIDHFENTFFGNITDVMKKSPIKKRFTRSGSSNPVWKDR